MTLLYLIVLIIAGIIIAKLISVAIIKEAEERKERIEAAKKLIYACCGNCDEFTRHKERQTHGHCCLLPCIPGMLFFPNTKINAKWFCKYFNINREWRETHRVNMKSRPAEKGLIAQVAAAGQLYD